MYRVIPDSAVLDQIAAMPAEVLPLVAEVFSVLELHPRCGRPYNGSMPDGPMRELVFGSHHEAVVTYLILEHTREVHVLVVQWIG